jgi:hypothetical protein
MRTYPSQSHLLTNFATAYGCRKSTSVQLYRKWKDRCFFAFLPRVREVTRGRKDTGRAPRAACSSAMVRTSSRSGIFCAASASHLAATRVS